MFLRALVEDEYGTARIVDTSAPPDSDSVVPLVFYLRRLELACSASLTASVLKVAVLEWILDSPSNYVDMHSWTFLALFLSTGLTLASPPPGLEERAVNCVVVDSIINYITRYTS